MKTVRSSKLSFLVVLILAAACADLFAWGAGTTRMNFLKINPSARSAGMGNASSSVARDIYSVNTNPAGLVKIKNRELTFSRLNWLEGITYNWIGYGVNLTRSGSMSQGSDEFDRIIIDDFDDGSDPNMVNGGFGTWSDSDEGGSSSVQTGYYGDDMENVYNSSGYSFEIKYDVRPLPNNKPGQAGAWIGLNNLNANRFMFLSFMVKGAAGSESFRVGLRDLKGGETKVPVKGYSKITTGWTRIDIPLEDFPGVDLANLENVSFTFSGVGKVYIDDVKFWGDKAPKKIFAVSFGQLDSGAMVQYDEIDIAPFYEKKESFSAQETILVLSYAREFMISSLNVPIGMNFKTIRERLHPNVAPSWGLAVDLGAMHDFATSWGNVVMGLTFQNMGYATPPQDVTDPMPMNVKTSIAAFPRAYNIAFDMDIDSPIDNKFKLSMGFEGWVGNTFACRIGYAFGQDLGGLGVGFGFNVAKITVDYALAPYSLFGNTHRLSLTYKW
ncbi:MAG: carbohydrate binding domain-containing protein [Elusimicrobiota bacterium]